MLEFQPLTYRNLPLLKGYIERCEYRIAGYSVTCKMMWQDFYHAEFCFSHGCLIFKNVIYGKITFNYPVPFDPSADEIAALKEIEEYCVEKYIPLSYMDVPEEKISVFAGRYRFMTMSDSRNYEDYLYNAEDFRTFSGKKFAGQRNHVNKFVSSYPNARYCVFLSEDKDKIDRFLDEFLQEDASEGKKRETELARKLLMELPLEDYYVGGYVLDGKIISIAFGTKMGDTLFVHIEKGLRAYEGVYTATANAFATAEGDAVFINREDDSGTRGLRMSKTQYHPCRMVKKFFVNVKNEWENVKKFPTIKTERLILDAVKKEDAEAYFDLCTDDERNKYWGYDYKKDLKCELYPEYFYDVQKEDKKNKMCFSFAVRLQGKMIGEGVLYRFTCTGRAEAGMRIDKKYAGHGYGREAFSALVDWALYGLGLTEVVSKCYHENAASFAMLSSKMKFVGKDDVFNYFSIVL